MALISKSDLYYKHYTWTALPKDDPKVTGNPDSTLLNRHQGYEILYFINKFAELHGLTNKLDAIKIEKMIRNDVPSNIHSQDKIKLWIEQNF